MIEKQQVTPKQTIIQRANIVGKYASYNEIINFLNKIQASNSYAKVYNAGNSIEGRYIPVIKLNTGSDKKRAVWFDCGIHAREWISPATCIYLINRVRNLVGVVIEFKLLYLC